MRVMKGERSVGRSVSRAVGRSVGRSGGRSSGRAGGQQGDEQGLTKMMGPQHGTSTRQDSIAVNRK